MRSLVYRREPSKSWRILTSGGPIFNRVFAVDIGLRNECVSSSNR